MPLDLNFGDAVLFAKIQTTPGTPETLVGTDAIATMGMNPDVYEGDRETISFDGEVGDDQPEIVNNPENIFPCETYLPLAGAAGTAPPLSDLFQICGAKETISAGVDVQYEKQTDTSLLKIGTVAARDQKNATTDMIYSAYDVRGQVGFQVTAGQRPRLPWSLRGPYVEPAEGSILTADFGTQKTSLPPRFVKPKLVTMTLDGIEVCVFDFNIDNLFGYTPQRDESSCGGTNMIEATPTGSITVKMPDWSGEFNPHAYASTETAVQRWAMAIALGDTAGSIVELDWTEVQFGKVTRVSVNGNKLGAQIPLRFLSPTVLTFK